MHVQAACGYLVANGVRGGFVGLGKGKKGDGMGRDVIGLEQLCKVVLCVFRRWVVGLRLVDGCL